MVISLNKSEETEKMIPIIKAIISSENLGKNLMSTPTFFVKILLIIIPSISGKITIQKVDFIKAKILKSIISFINTKTSKGVKNTDKNVEAIVKEIDKGKWAFDRYAITFDAVPPGQQPKTTNPISNSSLKPNNFAKKKEAVGIIVNCNTNPVIIHLGLKNTCLIWLNVIVSPIPNITSPRKKGIYDFKLINKLGSKNEINNPENIKIGKVKLILYL